MGFSLDRKLTGKFGHQTILCNIVEATRERSWDQGWTLDSRWHVMLSSPLHFIRPGAKLWHDTSRWDPHWWLRGKNLPICWLTILFFPDYKWWHFYCRSVQKGLSSKYYSSSTLGYCFFFFLECSVVQLTPVTSRICDVHFYHRWRMECSCVVGIKGSQNWGEFSMLF